MGVMEVRFIPSITTCPSPDYDFNKSREFVKSCPQAAHWRVTDSRSCIRGLALQSALDQRRYGDFREFK